MKEILSILGGLLFLLGFVPYIRAILRKETRPSKASWIIWVVLDTVTLVGMYFKDAVNGQIVGAVLGGYAIIFLAMKYGTPGWTKLDKFCLGGAVIGIVFWQAFNNPVLGIMTSLCVVFLGSIPTFVSAWKDPSREDKLAWTLFWLSCVFAVPAIPRWTLADASQPIVFLVVENVMMFILYVRPRLLGTKGR